MKDNHSTDQSNHSQLGRTSFCGNFTSAVSKYSIRSSFSSLFLRLPVKRRYSSSVLERFHLFSTLACGTRESNNVQICTLVNVEDIQLRYPFGVDPWNSIPGWESWKDR